MEKLYQYVWKYRMWNASASRLADGREVEVIDPGILNTDAGPDFFNGKVIIDGTEWAGNIEIHVKASDWRRHGHDGDSAYDNVILHVVGVDDARVCRSDGSEIPQLVVALPSDFYTTFARLEETGNASRCAPMLSSVPEITVTDWLETVGVERMQEKAERVKRILDEFDGDWEHTCFVMLARAMGFGLNSESFELLARSIPLRILHAHSDSLFQLEAILFGQAGMLDSSSNIFDDYYQRLCREYAFLLHKYGLRPIPAAMWKYARTRPQNFPHRRIALLAKAALGGFRLLRTLLDTPADPEDMSALFSWRLEGYWHDHFGFGREASMAADTLSKDSIRLLLINLVAPMCYSYGTLRGDDKTVDKSFRILEMLPPERNAIVRNWDTSGLKASNAFLSQALLHLRLNYCDKGKCMYCRIGHRMLRAAALAD